MGIIDTKYLETNESLFVDDDIHMESDNSMSTISLTDRLATIFMKHECFDPTVGMYLSEIIDALKEEFPTPYDHQAYNPQRVADRMCVAYFHRTKDERGKSLYSFNEERYSQRRKYDNYRVKVNTNYKMCYKNPPPKLLYQSNGLCGKVSDHEQHLGNLSITELVLSVFMVFPSKIGYSVKEVSTGVWLLYPMNSFNMLSSKITEELSTNACFKEVPSVCENKIYKLDPHDKMERTDSYRYRVLQKLQQQLAEQYSGCESLHAYCKRHACRTQAEEIPEESRSETELSSDHILLGVLLISPVGDYSLGELTKRVALLYPNNVIRQVNKSLAQSLHCCDKVDKACHKNGVFYYRIDEQFYKLHEYRRQFVLKRLPKLNLAEHELQWLLHGRHPSVSKWNSRRSDATKDLLDMSILKKEIPVLPRFRKRKDISKRHALKCA